MTGLTAGAMLPKDMNEREFATWCRSQGIEGVATNAIAAHVALPDPHTQYAKDTDLAASDAAQAVAIAAAVAALAARFKAQRVTTGSVATVSTALVTVTWTAPFADTNYTVTASVEDSTAALASLTVLHVETKTAVAVAVRVYNSSGISLTGTLHVIAVHD